MIDNWLASADYDAWRIGRDEDDGADTDNSLDWVDRDTDDPMFPAECPDCGDTLIVDEGDPDEDIIAEVHCDTCGWTSMHTDRSKRIQ